MPDDAPLKVEAWPIENVIAYANHPTKRSACCGTGRGVSSCERLSDALRQPRTSFVPSKCKHLGCKRIAIGRWRKV